MAKTQGQGRVLEVLLGSSESPVAAAQSLLDSAVAAGTAFDIVSASGNQRVNESFGHAGGPVSSTEDDDGLSFLMSILGLEETSACGVGNMNGTSDSAGKEREESTIPGESVLVGLEPRRAGDVGANTTESSDIGRTSVGQVMVDALPGMTADLCINHESGGGAGKNPLSARVACETGKVILKGGEATVEADGGEKRSRAQINALKASGGGPFSAGRRGMGECTRHSHSSGSLEDTGRSVGERRRRSVAHGSQGQQPSQKRGTIAISDERRGDQAGLSFGSNHGSSASGTAGFLPSLLLNDSALALQTALVALLQLQKQDQDGVQKEPVIPRRNLMCTAFLKTGACNNPERCNYAHNMVELQKKLELRKTSLCKYWLKGKCENEDCNFAHGEHELQSTEGVYKTTICKYWKQGACYSGNSCRHAHGEADLRPEKLPPHLERKRNQKVKQQWKSGGGGVAFPSSEAQPGGGPRTKQQPLYPSVPTRFPCSQGASFDGIKASEAFERPGSVVLGIGGNNVDTTVVPETCGSFVQGSCQHSSEDSLRRSYVPHSEQICSLGAGRTARHNSLRERFDYFPAGLGGWLSSGWCGARAGQNESLCGRGAWSRITPGGRASDEISDMSTASATSSRWGGADSRSSLPSFQDFTRENSGGSDSLLRSGNLNATRGSSLAEEETRVGMAWRSGGSGCGSVASDASTISVPLFPAVQSIGGPGGLVFVPPPGLAMQKDFGGVAVGRSASLTAAFPQKDDAELDERSGNLISSRCPYVSESVLRTLSESVAGLTVDETAAGRARAASGDPLPHQVGRGCGHMEAPEAVGEEKHGLITATTLSSLSVGFFAGMEDESSAPSKRDSETASPALSSASR